MKQRPRVVLALVGLGFVQLLASQKPANPPAPPTSAISGVVFDGVTKQPVAGALVSILVPGADERPDAQLTDARGRFVFLNLAAAPNYALTADRLGYGPTPYARHAKPGAAATPVVLRDGEWLSDLQLALWRRGAITGTITDERGEPVADIFVRAITLVRLHGQDHPAAGPLTATDDRGIYRLPDLPPGRYLIHVPTVHATVPTAALPAGVPAQVAATSMDLGAGARLVLNQYPTPPPPLDGRARAYSMTFHPAARVLADAQVVSLGMGDERTVDVRIEPVNVFRVSGRVDGPPDALTALTLRLVPTGLEALGLGSETATAMVAADGTFTFGHVPSGTYMIDAPRVVSELTTNRAFSSRMMLPRPPGRGGWSSFARPIEMAPEGTSLNTLNYRGAAPNYWARTSVTVDDNDRTGVVVTMRAGGSLRGTLVAETGAGSTGPEGVMVYLEPASPEFGPAMLQADAGAVRSSTTFTIQGLLATPYWLRARQAEWVVKSIMWKGRDHADVPFDGAVGDISDVVVTVTRASAVVTGTARDSSGQAMAGATVLAFPAERALRSQGLSPARIKTVVTATDGSYRLTSLPAGEYLLLATDGVTAIGLSSPEFFQAAERSAVRRTLTWGQTETVDLMVSEVR